MKNNDYLAQPKYILKRQADYKTQEYINSVFETISEKDYPESGTSGNLGSQIHVNVKTRKIKICKPPYFNDEKFKDFRAQYVGLYKAISSALALYRLICIFPNPQFVSLSGGEGYKMPWEIMLRHKKTGEIIGFGEWKGAFNVRGTTDEKGYKKETIKDFTKLVNLILSDKAPHPYDGTVAGSVA